MRTGLTKQEKTTDIWFDEKDPLIYIHTHNTDLKNRLGYKCVKALSVMERSMTKCQEKNEMKKDGTTKAAF